MSTKWTSVSLNGRIQVLPRICPATLRPAQEELRYGYRGPFYFLMRTTYYQSFYYAGDAAQAVKAWLKHRSRRILIWVLVVLILMPAALFGTAMLTDPHPSLRFLTWVAPVLGLVVGWLLVTWSRRSTLARHPVPADAICRGPAAYYTGSGWNLTGRRAVYKARRPEWIRALVEANPDQVDDATYAQITGNARPQPENAKPFG